MFSKLHKQLTDFFLLRKAQESGSDTTSPGISCAELEPRVLYSAVPLDVGTVEPEINQGFEVEASETDFENAPALDWSNRTADESFAELVALDDLVAAENGLLSQDASSREIVFVSENVEGYQELIDSISTDSSRNTEIIILDSEQNGIEKITNTLAQYTNIHAVHFVTHGGDGELLLGNTRLNSETLSQYQDQISGWANSLADGADLLFYGCELTETQVGIDFADSLAELTNADIAASSDLTGHDALDGDWNLEYVIGELTTEVIVSAAIQENWSQTLTIDAVGGVPALWTSTVGNGIDINGVTWSGRDVVQFGDPNLQFEPTSDTTTGTFEIVGFSPPVGVAGMHVVNLDSVEVGDSTLFQGDLLISIKSEHDFGSFIADEHDIVLFRPDAANDYTSGTYSLFLDEAVHNATNTFNIRGFTLVEKTTTVAGVELEAGTLLASHSGSAVRDNLYVVSVETTSIGATSTTSTNDEVLFLNGSSPGIGIDNERIQGVELLENTIEIGGTTLNQGSILLILDGSETVGTDDLSVAPHDIFVLDVVQAAPNGPSIADATLLFEGNDVGLTTNGETLESLSFVNSVTPVASTLTVDTTADLVDGDTSSTDALLANRGADGLISFREALEATNNSVNGEGIPDTILFNIADDDAGHYYYRDDGIPNSLSLVATTTLDDGSITDFDPDYAYTPHSWFRFDIDNTLPQFCLLYTSPSPRD